VLFPRANDRLDSPRPLAALRRTAPHLGSRAMARSRSARALNLARGDCRAHRHRRRDRLPYRPAVHVILPRQRPYRHLIALPVEADRREQLHSPLHPAPPEQDKHQIAQRSARPPQMSRNTPGVPPATPTPAGPNQKRTTAPALFSVGPDQRRRIPVVVATLATDGWDRIGLNE
jgi:hypothetical protein